MTARVSSSNRIGRSTIDRGRRAAERRADRRRSRPARRGGGSAGGPRRTGRARPSPNAIVGRRRRRQLTRIRREEREHRRVAVQVGEVEDARWMPTSGASSARISRPTIAQVALALEHPPEPGDVRLQPVDLLVPLRRLAQVPDHLVDVVLEELDLALRLDLDGSRQVAAGHGGRHLADRPDLGREVRRELVDVVGEVLPRPADAADVGLAAELALGADLAGDAGHLGRRTRSAGRPSC